ncbi:MAG: alpha/beta fold hydrolase [Melioribacteraceae bacterium]|nr:alpha/beta fold hydrolase [Melioribacteraceae bacterium]
MIGFDPVTQDAPNDPKFPASMQPLTFNSHGCKLLGTFFFASGEGLHSTVLLLHGFPGNEVNYDIAHAVRRMGYNVMVFHYRGCWGSEGEYLWTNLVQDTDSAIQFLKSGEAGEKYKVDRNKIVLIGHSMGGFAATYNSTKYDDIKNVASLAGFNAGLFGEFIEGNNELIQFSADTMQPAMEFVKCESAVTLLNEMISNKKEWNLLNHLDTLSGKNWLIVSSKYDTITPLEIHHKPLVGALKMSGAANFEEHILETGHSFSDSRIKLTRIICEWLSQLKF